MDSARRRPADAVTLLTQATPDLEELQDANIQRGAARRQLHSDEKRPEDFPLPLEVGPGKLYTKLKSFCSLEIHPLPKFWS